MPVNEASSTETPFGRYITSDGWFVLNLGEALAVRNPERGGGSIPSSRRSSRSSSLVSTCACCGPVTRMRSTTRKEPRRGFSCSRASAS